MVGLALINDGAKNFKSLSLEHSNFFVPSDGKSLVSLYTGDNNRLIVASQNNDSLRVFEPRTKDRFKTIKLRPNEVKIRLDFEDGTQHVQEFYWGSTFQSQSSRRLSLNGKNVRVTYFDTFGKETRNESL